MIAAEPTRLTSVGDSKDKLGLYLSECRRMGIKVLAPDVNESYVDFTAVPNPTGVGDIRFGLGAVRNVGANVVELRAYARDPQAAARREVDEALVALAARLQAGAFTLEAAMVLVRWLSGDR